MSRYLFIFVSFVLSPLSVVIGTETKATTAPNLFDTCISNLREYPSGNKKCCESLTCGDDVTRRSWKPEESRQHMKSFRKAEDTTCGNSFREIPKGETQHQTRRHRFATFFGLARNEEDGDPFTFYPLASCFYSSRVAFRPQRSIPGLLQHDFGLDETSFVQGLFDTSVMTENILQLLGSSNEGMAELESEIEYKEMLHDQGSESGVKSNVFLTAGAISNQILRTFADFYPLMTELSKEKCKEYLTGTAGLWKMGDGPFNLATVVTSQGSALESQADIIAKTEILKQQVQVPDAEKITRFPIYESMNGVENSITQFKTKLEAEIKKKEDALKQKETELQSIIDSEDKVYNSKKWKEANKKVHDQQRLISREGARNKITEDHLEELQRNLRAMENKVIVKKRNKQNEIDTLNAGIENLRENEGKISSAEKDLGTMKKMLTEAEKNQWIKYAKDRLDTVTVTSPQQQFTEVQFRQTFISSSYVSDTFDEKWFSNGEGHFNFEEGNSVEKTSCSQVKAISEKICPLIGGVYEEKPGKCCFGFKRIENTDTFTIKCEHENCLVHCCSEQRTESSDGSGFLEVLTKRSMVKGKISLKERATKPEYIDLVCKAQENLRKSFKRGILEIRMKSSSTKTQARPCTHEKARFTPYLLDPLYQMFYLIDLLLHDNEGASASPTTPLEQNLCQRVVISVAGLKNQLTQKIEKKHRQLTFLTNILKMIKALANIIGTSTGAGSAVTLITGSIEILIKTVHKLYTWYRRKSQIGSENEFSLAFYDRILDHFKVVEGQENSCIKKLQRAVSEIIAVMKVDRLDETKDKKKVIVKGEENREPRVIVNECISRCNSKCELGDPVEDGLAYQKEHCKILCYTKQEIEHMITRSKAPSSHGLDAADALFELGVDVTEMLLDSAGTANKGNLQEVGLPDRDRH